VKSSAAAAFGFSTIGCPAATLAEAVDLAREFNLDFVELRALEGTVDLPKYFADHPLRKEDANLRPPVRIVATNLHLISATDQEVDHFLRFVDVAMELGAPYVRIFGGGEWNVEVPAAGWDRAVKVVGLCRQAMKEKGARCEMLLEMHSAFCSSAMCAALNKKLPEPVSILWDAHHSWHSAGESPAETWRQLGPLVRHLHVSDSRDKTPPASGYDCVLPGTGEYPFAELRKVLSENHYAHTISLEWERLWHPELPDIRLALPEYRRLLVEA
jgi:sugar phosphate isomerase/epimerase